MKTWKLTLLMKICIIFTRHSVLSHSLHMDHRNGERIPENQRQTYSLEIPHLVYFKGTDHNLPTIIRERIKISWPPLIFSNNPNILSVKSQKNDHFNDIFETKQRKNQDSIIIEQIDSDFISTPGENTQESDGFNSIGVFDGFQFSKAVTEQENVSINNSVPDAVIDSTQNEKESEIDEEIFKVIKYVLQSSADRVQFDSDQDAKEISIDVLEKQYDPKESENKDFLEVRDGMLTLVPQINKTIEVKSPDDNLVGITVDVKESLQIIDVNVNTTPTMMEDINTKMNYLHNTITEVCLSECLETKDVTKTNKVEPTEGNFVSKERYSTESADFDHVSNYDNQNGFSLDNLQPTELVNESIEYGIEKGQDKEVDVIVSAIRKNELFFLENTDDGKITEQIITHLNEISSVQNHEVNHFTIVSEERYSTETGVKKEYQEFNTTGFVTDNGQGDELDIILSTTIGYGQESFRNFENPEEDQKTEEISTMRKSVSRPDETNSGKNSQNAHDFEYEELYTTKSIVYNESSTIFNNQNNYFVVDNEENELPQMVENTTNGEDVKKEATHNFQERVAEINLVGNLNSTEGNFAIVSEENYSTESEKNKEFEEVNSSTNSFVTKEQDRDFEVIVSATRGSYQELLRKKENDNINQTAGIYNLHKSIKTVYEMNSDVTEENNIEQDEKKYLTGFENTNIESRTEKINKVHISVTKPYEINSAATVINNKVNNIEEQYLTQFTKLVDDTTIESVTDKEIYKDADVIVSVINHNVQEFSGQFENNKQNQKTVEMNTDESIHNLSEIKSTGNYENVVDSSFGNPIEELHLNQPIELIDNSTEDRQVYTIIVSTTRENKPDFLIKNEKSNEDHITETIENINDSGTRQYEVNSVETDENNQYIETSTKYFETTITEEPVVGTMYRFNEFQNNDDYKLNNNTSDVYTENNKYEPAEDDNEIITTTYNPEYEHNINVTEKWKIREENQKIKDKAREEYIASLDSTLRNSEYYIDSTTREFDNEAENEVQMSTTEENNSNLNSHMVLKKADEQFMDENKINLLGIEIPNKENDIVRFDIATESLHFPNITTDQQSAIDIMKSDFTVILDPLEIIQGIDQHVYLESTTDLEQSESVTSAAIKRDYRNISMVNKTNEFSKIRRENEMKFEKAEIPMQTTQFKTSTLREVLDEKTLITESSKTNAIQTKQTNLETEEPKEIENVIEYSIRDDSKEQVYTNKVDALKGLGKIKHNSHLKIAEDIEKNTINNVNSLKLMKINDVAPELMKQNDAVLFSKSKNPEKDERRGFWGTAKHEKYNTKTNQETFEQQSSKFPTQYGTRQRVEFEPISSDSAGNANFHMYQLEKPMKNENFELIDTLRQLRSPVLKTLALLSKPVTHYTKHFAAFKDELTSKSLIKDIPKFLDNVVDEVLNTNTEIDEYKRNYQFNNMKQAPRYNKNVISDDNFYKPMENEYENNINYMINDFNERIKNKKYRFGSRKNNQMIYSS